MQLAKAHWKKKCSALNLQTKTIQQDGKSKLKSYIKSRTRTYRSQMYSHIDIWVNTGTVSACTDSRGYDTDLH